ncbi:MAG: ribosome-binding factor A [Isosphaeraceae bacterium]|nr:ribosome-binding factor A [Isosphaeraceae bacterium]
MRRRIVKQNVLRHLCAEQDATDGVDPRDDQRSTSRKRSDRKQRQLCGQVAETLSYVLSGRDADASLSQIQVFSVVPAPDAGRLLVTVAPLPGERLDPTVVLDALERASGRLRDEVATAVTRKRAPLLAFRVALPGPFDR